MKSNKNLKEDIYGITPETLQWGFKKLKYYYYYYSGCNFIKDKIIKFEDEIKNDPKLFEKVANKLNSQVDAFNWVTLYSQVSSVILPKKNSFKDSNNFVLLESFNEFIDLPLEYYIVDVLFAINIFNKFEPNKNSLGFVPSSYFDSLTSDKLHNKYLFDYYWKGYEEWTKIPYNSYLKDKDSTRVILRLDAKECFYYAKFNFARIISNLGIKNNVSFIMGSIFRSYSSLVLKEKYDKTKESDISILPVGLLSSSVILNYLFKPIDEAITESKNVIRYGRFVDDLCIVIKSESDINLVDAFSLIDKKLFCEKDNVLYLNSIGFLMDPIELNSEKTNLIFFDRTVKPNVEWREIISPSFVDDYLVINNNDDHYLIDSKYDKFYLSNGAIEDYVGFSKRLSLLSAAELLNCSNYWAKIFRIIKNNNDENFYSFFRRLIENAINKIFYNDKIIMSKIKNSLISESNFCAKISKTDASNAHYLFNVVDEDINLLIKKFVEQGIDEIPFFVTISDLSIYFSLKEITISSNIKELVKNNYAKINNFNTTSDLMISACELNCENAICKLETGSENNNKVKIAIACIPMETTDEKDSIKFYVDHYGKMSKASLFNIFNIIDEAEKEECDYVVFPEFALNKNNLNTIIKYCRKKNLSLISGLEYFNLSNIAYNLNVIYDKSSGLVLARQKNDLPLEEIRMLNKMSLKPYIPAIKQYLIVNDSKLTYSSMVCYELTNIKDRASLAGEINCLFVPTYNRDTHYFSNIIESFSRDASCFVVQANCNKYGDSRIRQPSRTEIADIVKTKGGLNIHCLIDSIDPKQLKDANSEYLSKKSKCEEYMNKNFKPLSAGDFSKK